MKEEGVLQESKTLDSQPGIFTDSVWLWNAFEWLSRRRNYGMNGPQPITSEAMKAYCDLKGIRRDDDIDLLMHIVGTLDDAWLADFYGRQKERQDKEANRGSGKRY